ncbi:MAG: hypothetical protein LBJ64_08990, partial [Deltaproteobacteria bacterium]|nr:hypothetical protein [Deltaproteobacteria bacterium]
RHRRFWSLCRSDGTVSANGQRLFAWRQGLAIEQLDADLKTNPPGDPPKKQREFLTCFFTCPKVHFLGHFRKRWTKSKKKNHAAMSAKASEKIAAVREKRP